MRSKTSRSKTPCLVPHNKSVKEMFKPIKKTIRNTVDLKTSTPQLKQTSITSSPLKTDIIKRNLFGIRLNHDQLNRDLKEMWREQIEKQKEHWNFDFEKLKPVHLNRSSKSLNDLSLNDTTRYDWIRVNTYYGPGVNGYSPSLQSISLPDHLLDSSIGLNTDFVVSAFDKNEIDYEHKFYKDESTVEETETEEEEEDEALAVPQFYKYQRRLKLIKEKEEDKENSKKVQNGKIVKPKRVLTRRTRRASTGQSEGKKLTQSLIITFSENRKDTLRSAHNMTSGINKNDDKKDKMKQQSLLDLFKQRKRKTSGSQ